MTETETHSSLKPHRPPLVSVVMSSFNDEAHVALAIQSIQQQSLPDWEFIIVNDGSTDGTGKILDHYAERDSRIRVIHQQNSGLTKALIRGCQEVRGKYIARQDADDISLPRRLEQQLRLLTSCEQIGFVSSWAESFTPDGARLDLIKRQSDPKTATFELLQKRQGPPAHGSVMMRKNVYEAVGGYRSCFYYGQDSDLWMRLAEVSQIAFIPEVLYKFLRSPASISGSMAPIQHQFGEIGQNCRLAREQGQSEAPLLAQASALTGQLLEQRGSPRNAAPQHQLAMTYLIGSQLVRNRDVRARHYLWQVIRQKPWHWKAWVRLAQSLVSGEKREARNEERAVSGEKQAFSSEEQQSC